MKLTYKKDKLKNDKRSKSFEFESKYVEIHIKVYSIPPTGHLASLFGDVYTEFDVSLFELMDSQLSIDNYTLNKFPELKPMYPYHIRIMVTDIKLYDCDSVFESRMKSLIQQYDDIVHYKKDDFLFDLSYEQKDSGSDITVTFLNCLFAGYGDIGFDIDHGNFIHLTPEWFNVVYD